MLFNISPGWPGSATMTLPDEVASTSEEQRPERWAGGAVESVRIRPARIADMKRIEELIKPFARQNLMLPKSADQLARTFREFMVAEDQEGRIVGCAALRVYTQQLAEVCSLAVDDRVQGLGVGRKLVESLVVEGRSLGLETLFALTLNSAFFGRLGFAVVPRDDFPLKVWADCRTCPKLHACDEIAVARRL